ncbi:MAG: hypothetical protein OEZ33_00775 [Gammaproteobacteria bacterium]|nr:hypothetical protein [Gammaproteobacteria bacterium]
MFKDSNVLLSQIVVGLINLAVKISKYLHGVSSNGHVPPELAMTDQRQNNPQINSKNYC